MNPRPWLPARLRGADRLILASGALTAFSILVFTVNLIHPVLPDALIWAPLPINGTILALVYRRTARASALQPAVARFWRHMTVVAAAATLANTSQAIDVLTSPDIPGQRVGPAMQFFDSICVLVIVYALYRLPLARQTRGERVRVGLDAGTVMLATAVLMWHFQTWYALRDAQDTTDDWAALALTTFSLAAVFAVVKVVLSSETVVDGAALRLFAIAMLVASGGPLFRDYLEPYRPHLFPETISMPVVFFISALAGERQRKAELWLRHGGESRRRPFSMFPYLAVAAVDALLLFVAWTDHRDQQVVIAAAVVLTAVVVLRQVLAFRENGRLLQRLDHNATHDALTHLPNRVLFNKRLQSALTAAGDRPIGVALIDLDDFKEVNDTLGHEIGDVLLVAVAERLSGCMRPGDMVARLGGDEFVVVLDGADPATADLVADRMKEALSTPLPADGHELPIRASIGIADGRTGDEASVLLRQADIAMYAAKNVPGTAHLHYRDEMNAAGSDSAQLGAELRTAIAEDQLFLLYQPIVSLDDRRVIGAEALVRWSHPERGTLGPDSFIPIAERTGLVVPLSRWVLRSALRQLAAWHRAGAPPNLNVNISARDLREPDFVAAVAALLEEFRLPGSRVTFEVTETMALEPGPSITTLHELRTLGIRVSLDDFGTGHSPLTLLHDCPVDELKLDRAFTQSDRAPVAAAVIHLARSFGLHAVAEGVETPEQAEQLRALGYTAAQGYHFARPMPGPQMGDLIDGRKITPVRV